MSIGEIVRREKMTHEDMGHYAAKHSANAAVDPLMEVVLREKISNGKISCASAHQIAEAFHVLPVQVGMNIDLMEVRLHKCQLGLFGYGKQEKPVKQSETLSPELVNAITLSMTEGRISCEACWKIAQRMGCPKLAVSRACEAMKIKIFQCQLRAF